MPMSKKKNQWTHITLRIFGTFEIGAITKSLNIQPTESFAKGDLFVPGDKKSARKESDGWLFDFECADLSTSIENLNSFLQFLSKKQPDLATVLKQGKVRGDLYVSIGGNSSFSVPFKILEDISKLGLGLTLNFYP